MARTARLRTVRAIDFWPDNGWPDRPWADDPVIDRFARLARSVFESYQVGLAASGLEARWSSFRLAANHFGSLSWPDAEGLSVIAHPGPAGGMGWGSVRLPAELLGWTPVEVRTLALEVIDRYMRLLANDHGWDVAELERLSGLVVENDYRFAWTSDELVSPNRRKVAQGVFEIEEIGYGSVVVTVTDRDDQSVWRSESILVPPSLRSFKRVAKSLAWSRNSVELRMRELPGDGVVFAG